MLEMLHLVPKAVGFDEARHVMGNLSTLRPEVVQPLLEACGSVKVKRLFLYLSESHDHAWFAKLDPGKVDPWKGQTDDRPPRAATMRNIRSLYLWIAMR